MSNEMSHRSTALPKFGTSVKWIRGPAVLLLGLALTLVPPQPVFGQSNQQQEQQRREEQQREQQQRDQQQREEQQRQQQEREQQQREEQQRQQQERDQQQREEQQRQQQEREQQQREEQQRQQQEHDQQQREQQRQQQERDQQQLEERQRQQQLSSSPDPVASPHVTTRGPESNGENSVPQKQFPELNRKTNLVQRENAKISKDHESATHETNLQVRKCQGGSCKEPEAKQVATEQVAAKCKTKPCAKCPAGQPPGKDNSCVAAPAQARAAAKNAATAPQACPVGQLWNGVQCAFIGTQQCMPGQIAVGGSCRAGCTLPTAEAQNYIVLLRSARQDKDDACLRNPNGQQCRDAEATYNIRLNEYQGFLGGVPTECGLPNPFAI